MLAAARVSQLGLKGNLWPAITFLAQRHDGQGYPTPCMLLKAKTAMLLKPLEQAFRFQYGIHGYLQDAMTPTTKEREARYRKVFWRVQQRLSSYGKTRAAKGDVKDVPWHEGLECKLGHETRLRRSDKCSVCPVNADDFEIDKAVAALISENVIQSSTRCPYLAFSAALFVVLMVGSEAVETAKQSEHLRIKELNKALEHIDRAIKTHETNRESMKYLAAREDEELFTRLADVIRAETLISKAVRFLIENFERNHGYKLDPRKPPPVRRGRRPALEMRSIIQPCEVTWQQLIGTRPGKHNVRFHALLQAAASTLLGPLDREPDWEGQIVAARAERARGKLDPKK
jgi:hypothetical protein